MILVAYQRTMAGAKQVVADTGMRQRVLKARPRYVEPAPIAPLVRLPVARERVYHRPRGLERVIDLVVRMHGCTLEEVMSKSRQRHHVLARYAAICAIQEIRPCLSLPGLGRLFSKDHTTILHALHKRGFR